MKKNLMLLASIAVLTLTGCSNVNSNEVTQDSDDKEESSSITVNSFDSNYPNMIISKGPSENSLLIGNSKKDRLDKRQFESGLMSIGMDSFGKDKFLVADNTILLDNKDMNDILSKNLINVLTYNYYEVDNSNAHLSGILIGIQMSSTHSDSELTSKATEVSKKILEIIRADNNATDTPVVFAIFKQRPVTARVQDAISGNFVLRSEATTNSTLGEWKQVNEKYFLYPSSNLTSAKASDAKKIDTLVSNLNKKIDSRDHIGVSGIFMYADDELQKVNLTFTVRFDSKMKIVATVAAISELVLADIPDTFDIEITLNSDTQTEALIVRNKNEDIFTHVY